MSTTFGNTAAVSDTLAFGADLQTLANGAYSVPCALIDNTPSGPHGVSYTSAWLRISFSSPLTAGAGSPSIIIYRIPAADGTNPSNPPGLTAQAPSPNAPQSIFQIPASGSFSVLDCWPFTIDSTHYEYMVLNNSGVEFSGTVTVTLYRETVQSS